MPLNCIISSVNDEKILKLAEYNGIILGNRVLLVVNGNRLLSMDGKLRFNLQISIAMGNLKITYLVIQSVDNVAGYVNAF